jgi:hypothetical protein
MRLKSHSHFLSYTILLGGGGFLAKTEDRAKFDQGKAEIRFFDEQSLRVPC